MPELPEVEVVVRQLGLALVGVRLRRVDVRHPDVFVPARGLSASRLRNCEVRRVWRRAKLILMDLDDDLVLTVHLRMTGHLSIVPASEPMASHTHVVWTLPEDRHLRFRDPRRFGRVALLRRADLGREPFLARLGPEPFDLDPEALERALRRRTGTLKGALLDQSLVAGLGNIYVDEILFRAGLHPTLVACRLKPAELGRLHECMTTLLREAIAMGGSTIRDYLPLSRQPGRFQTLHRVFGRQDQPCLQCGERIRKIKVAGRGTHFCPRCQPWRRRVRRRPRSGRPSVQALPSAARPRSGSHAGSPSVPRTVHRGSV